MVLAGVTPPMPSKKLRGPAEPVDPSLPARGASLAQRAALARITQIHTALCAVQPGGAVRVSGQTLAAQLEVSVATAKRDLDTMRDQFGAPIAWNSGWRTYYYTEPFTLRPLLWLDSDEVLSLVLASRMFSAWRAFPLGRALAAALEKITPVLGGVVSLREDALHGVLSAPHDPANEAEHRHFALLFTACVSRRVVRLDYRKPEAGSVAAARVVHPLLLACVPDGCLLIAHDPARRGLRNFDLARITAAELTDEMFVPPADFDRERVLAGSLGRFIGEATHEVRLLFDARYAPYVRERPWHASQILTERADGSLEASYRVNHLKEIEHRVLACGGRAEVLAPPELRASLRAAAAALLARHT